MPPFDETTESVRVSNGSGAAAIFSVGFGLFVLSVFAIIVDQSQLSRS